MAALPPPWLVRQLPGTPWWLGGDVSLGTSRHGNRTENVVMQWNVLCRGDYDVQWVDCHYVRPSSIITWWHNYYSYIVSDSSDFEQEKFSLDDWTDCLWTSNPLINYQYLMLLLLLVFTSYNVLLSTWQFNCTHISFVSGSSCEW